MASGALTLLDMAQGAKDEVMKGIILNFARQSTLMQRITFRTVDSLTVRAWRSNSVTAAGTRKIGESYATVRDGFEPVQDGLAAVGDQIDIDRLLTLPGQSELDAWAENLAQESERTRYKFLDLFINGDTTVTVEDFNGLKVRVTATGGDQVINGASGDVLDLSANDANRQTFLDKMNRAVFETGMDGMPDFIVTGKGGFFTLEAVARRLGLLNTAQDAFDRNIMVYKGIPVDYAGKKADQSTEIITTTEDPGDAGNDSTSFYFLRMGHPYIQGVQLHEPKRVFDEILNDGVTHRTVFEWPVGLTAFHKKSITRLNNILAIG